MTLQRIASGSGTLSFGRLPTAVIVVQIAIAVALIPIVLTGTVEDFRDRLLTVSFPTDDYLTARLLVDSEVQLAASAADQEAGATEGRVVAIAGVTDRFHLGPSLLERYRAMRETVGERLRSEPAVRRFAFTTRLPGLLGQSIPATVLEVAGREDGSVSGSSSASPPSACRAPEAWAWREAAPFGWREPGSPRFS